MVEHFYMEHGTAYRIPHLASSKAILGLMLLSFITRFVRICFHIALTHIAATFGMFKRPLVIVRALLAAHQLVRRTVISVRISQVPLTFILKRILT